MQRYFDINSQNTNNNQKIERLYARHPALQCVFYNENVTRFLMI